MDKEKYVDESWKETASEEKDKLANASAQPAGSTAELQTEVPNQDVAGSEAIGGEAGQEEEMGVNFLNYVASLGFQAMIFLGEIPNPATNEVTKNIGQAKFLIDTLDMIKEKTSGNLSEQEVNLLENSIYELQTKYVQIVQQEASSGGEVEA